MPVYFIQAGENGPVKIGFASDVSHRLRMFQTGHVERLSVIRTMGGGWCTERALHKRFSHLHIRGEWFGFDPEMLTVEMSVDETRAKLPPTAIGRWCDADGSAQALIEGIGISAELVRKWRQGTRSPHAKHWRDIVRITDGKVTIDDLLDVASQDPATKDAA